MRKNKIAIWYLAALLLLAAWACKHDEQMVSLGIDEVYHIHRMKTLVLSPGFTGEKYQWIQRLPDRGDSVVCTSHDFCFLQAECGSYRYRFQIIDEERPYKYDFSIEVREEEISYSPYISSVYEYCPAPGQFVNVMPEYREGDTHESMRKKVEECISGTNEILISLGGYGGYVTFAFDHTVCNIAGEKDFMILGNTFYSDIYGNREGGSAEPGIVEVAFDRNVNGLPDEDEWYELAGSEYDNTDTGHCYEITYYRPPQEKEALPDGSIYTDAEYIRWTDNCGESGYIPKNRYHTQDYFPAWVKEDSLVFSGTLLSPNGIDESGTGSYYVLYSYPWGYVDNQVNSKRDLNSFDIGWVVDADGNSVWLPGADFIRVYTAVNQCCGWLGETSTEIMQAIDLHLFTGEK